MICTLGSGIMWLVQKNKELGERAIRKVVEDFCTRKSVPLLKGRKLVSYFHTTGRHNIERDGWICLISDTPQQSGR